MVRVAPTFEEDFQLAVANNTYQVFGFNAIAAGDLLMVCLMGVRATASQHANVGEFYGLDPSTTAGQCGSDSGNGWRTNSLGRGTTGEGTGFLLPYWKIAEGDEVLSYPLLGRFSSTAFGTDPYWVYASRWSGIDPVDPVIARGVDWASAVSTLPSAAAETVGENSVELMLGTRQTGTSLLSWDTETTVLQSQTNTRDGDGSMRVVQNVGSSDGSIPQITSSGSGSVRQRRLFLQGASPGVPQDLAGNAEGEALLLASGTNVSQERRNAAQAQDRRQHIWVSDINGVRQVVMR